jgi:hypothetical protein
MRQIEVSVDVFAAIWAARLPCEKDESEILSRILNLNHLIVDNKCSPKEARVVPEKVSSGDLSSPKTLPESKKWTDLLTWTLMELGGKATLGQIYSKSRQGRSALGLMATAQHDASARECLESHCRESTKFRGKADLFYMPAGKGAGIWALR